MKRIGILFAVVVGFVTTWALVTPDPAAAQAPNIDDEVNRIAKTLYCPVCPNTPLDVCATQACVQWRALIKEMLQQGQTEQQISDYFVTQYGQQVLGAPPAQGFNWLAYILPVLGIVLGIVIAWAILRQWLTRSPVAAGAAGEESAIPREYADRIEQDLKEY